MKPALRKMMGMKASQAEFGAVVGVSDGTVSRLVNGGPLEKGKTLGEWIQAYCANLREQAAGRASDAGGEEALDLVQERAALAREQRASYEIKNAVARGEFAPIELLADVLATASQAVVERFEQLPGQMRKACPDLPDAARRQVETVIASARNEWIRATAELVATRVETTDDDEEEA